MDAYQHHGWRENKVCGTLTAGQNDTVRGDTPLICVPTAYSFDSLDSNAMRSSNPHSGCRVTEISKTLDTTNPNPSKRQGGMAVVEALPFDTTQVTSPQNGNNPKWGDPCHPLAAQGHPPTAICKVRHLYENHSQDTRYKGPLNVCPMLPAQLGTGGNNTPFVVEDRPVYCLQGSMLGRADKNGPQGDGVNEGGSFTLNTSDRHAVVYAETYQKVTGPLMANSHPGSYCGQDAYTDMLIVGRENKPVVFDKEVYQSGINASGGHYIAEGGPCPTLRCTGHPPGVAVNYIVRRLTPTECARLQGFADRWGWIDEKDSLTADEFQFWLDVRNTHAAINGKTVKDYTEEQILKWYNRLHTDSAEYKMWGNGIALPPALYCMQGIYYAMEGVSDDWML